MKSMRVVRTGSVMRMLCGAAVVVALGLSAARADAGLRVASVFGHQMVLQRDKVVPVWGWAEAGAEVKIEFAGQAKTAKAGADGLWMACLDPMRASAEGRTLKVSIRAAPAATGSAAFTNVVVGEVWLCSGQSNMAFPLSRASNAKEAQDSAADPMLRLLRVVSSPANDVVMEPTNAIQGAWAVAASDSAGTFPAVGWFFGRELRKALDVPVGLIGSSVGGTAAQLWTDKASLEARPETRALFDDYAKSVEAFDPQKTEAAHRAALERYRAIAEKAKAAGKTPPRGPRKAQNPKFKHPCKLYNGMIAPLQPYAIRGAIWYQGEANSSQPVLYETLLPAMIDGWRRTWANPPALGGAVKGLDRDDFPFLFVQLPGYSQPWMKMRESMARLAERTPNTGMAVVTEFGDETNIHPTHKQPVGERLALIARAKVYGEKIECSGPVLKKADFKDGAARLTFAHAEGGLVAKDGALKAFMVAGADRKFVEGTAKIDGDAVVVIAEGVAEPVAVRYAWSPFPPVTLYNKSGLPAMPFRTDEWPEGADSARR